MSKTAEIVNEVEKKLGPWYTIKWFDVEGPTVCVVEIGGMPMFLTREEDGTFSVCEARRDVDATGKQHGWMSTRDSTGWGDRIRKLLNGWVRDDSGELIQPKREP
jgi:hypothetical protein